MRRIIQQPRLYLAGIVCCFAALPAQGQIADMQYTLSTTAKHISFSNNAGLNGDYLYGGKLGVSFGGFLAVDGLFLLGNGLQTSFSDISEDFLADNLNDRQAALDALGKLSPRNVNLQQYGGKLRLNLLHGALVPFITGGAGIIRFAPDDLESSDVLYASVGVGVTINMGDRFSLSMAPENISYRYFPASTFLTDRDLNSTELSADDFRRVTVNNLALSASLQYSLGERSRLDSQFYGDNFDLAVELFYGQINFSDALDFPVSRTVAGITAGIDAGPYIGLRGFYWRDTEQENIFDDNIPVGLGNMKAYGGELNLRFRRGTTPYLIAGGGYMDIERDDDSFTDATGRTPASRYFASGGGGIEVPVSSSIKLQGSMRGLFMSTEASRANRPGDISTSVMYSASILFQMGGRNSGRTYDKPARQSDTESIKQVVTEAIETELAQFQARLDAMAQSDSSSAGAVDDILSIRVPETGEVYIRYGDPVMPNAQTVVGPPLILTTDTLTGQPSVGAPATTTDDFTLEEIRQIIREELQGLKTESPDIGRYTRRLQEIEKRLLAMERRMIDEYFADGQEDRDTTETQPSRQRVGIVKAFRQRQRVGRLAIIGFRMGDGPNQFLLGVRNDYRLPDYSVRLLPEASVGLLNGISFNVMGNIAFPIPVRWATPVQPYAGAGIGIDTRRLFSGLELVFNLLVGVEYSLFRNIDAFSEFNTQDLFDTSRLYFGVRLSH